MNETIGKRKSTNAAERRLVTDRDGCMYRDKMIKTKPFSKATQCSKPRAPSFRCPTTESSEPQLQGFRRVTGGNGRASWGLKERRGKLRGEERNPNLGKGRREGRGREGKGRAPLNEFESFDDLNQSFLSFFLSFSVSLPLLQYH